MTGHQRLACRTCGYILNINAFNQPEHPSTAPSDHPVDAAPSYMVKLVELCDFCTTNQSPWVLPVKSFAVYPGGESLGDWAACQECAELINADDWDGLTRRAIEHYQRRNPESEPILNQYFTVLYAAVRKNTTGPLRRS